MNPLISSKDQLAPLFQKRPTNYQPNVFTESRQEFTELEKKIVTLVVNQIGHMSLKGETIIGSNLVFNVPFSELTKNNHKQIADAAESLQSKRLAYRDDVKKEFHYITPFPSVRSAMIDGKRVIELIMFSAVVPHFAELGQRYTKYDIDMMLTMSSVYSQRMFEIVSMYQSRGQYQFSYRVDRLMEILNCPSQYIFNDFRRNALLIAQRELREKANIHLDWAVQKEGKKIVALDFTTKTTQQLATEAVKQDQRQINKMAINEAVTTAWQLMKGYKLKSWQKDLIISDHSLLETFYRVDSELANGLRTNIKSPTAYLVKSLGIDQKKDAKNLKTLDSKQLQIPGLSTELDALTNVPQSLAAIFGNMIMNE
ncbi:replication initiation protein [Spirosoma agri]|uniref:Replication initiation protein n=1 Tax=Spirosoma agri TaxID=1987381 RepID=A0A6M0IT18_9BACT|nr:replication initiation protein [Spirosoma agri]NEU70845.1 replication initiation protein [Spirosoma agri]